MTSYIFNKWDWILILLLITSCRSGAWKALNQGLIKKTFSKGTDSTFERQSYQGNEDAIYLTKTKCGNSLINTFFYYQDQKRKMLDNIQTFTNDERRGHDFTFYDDGMLKTYTYFVGDQKFSYRKDFSREGVLTNEVGTPLVEFSRSASQYVNLYFTSVLNDSLEVFVSEDHSAQMKLTVSASSLQPKLLYARLPLPIKAYFFNIKSYSKTFGDASYKDTLRSEEL